MRKLLLLSAAFASACLISLLLPVRLSLLLGLVALLLFAATRLFAGQHVRLLWLSFGLFLGFLWFFLYSTLFYVPSQNFAHKTIRLEAVVTQFPTKTEYGISVCVRGGEANGRSFPLRLYLGSEWDTLRPGDRISTIAHCTSTAQIAGAERFSLRSKGIYLFAQSYGAVQVQRAEHMPLRYAPSYLASWVRDQVFSLYHEDTAPLLLALLTGWQEELSSQARNDFSRSGLAHVVSVSGMHISFLAGTLGLLLGQRKRKSIFIQIAVIFFFAAMTGNCPGALRAAFLCSSTLLASLFGRRVDALTSLSASLLILLLANPFSVANAGLQFSFAATLGIYLLGQPLYRAWRKKLPKTGERFLAPLLSVLAISLGAMVFTTPLTALYFGQVSFVAPLSNLLTNVLVFAAFMGGILSVLFSALFAPLGSMLAILTELPARLFLALAHWFSKLPFAAVALTSVYYLCFFAFLYAILALWLYAWYRKEARPLIPLCSITISFCVSLLLTNHSLTAKPFSLSALDVGQGQSIVLTSGSYRALVDCGGTKDAGAVAANYLQSFGFQRLDLLVLTHYHEDHANGLSELLSRIKLSCIALPESEKDSPERKEIEALAQQYHCKLLYISEETTIAFGRAELCLFPPLSHTGDNEVGLSLLSSYGDWDALITGDMSEDLEHLLLHSYDLPTLELLVLGHHGSRYATSKELLAATTPERALVSVGKNSYGHPAPETLFRLQEAGTILYRTDTLGTVTVFAPETED